MSFVNLAWDAYYLVETAVPAGYQVDSTHHEFTIGYGALTVNFTDASAITNNKNSFTLKKTDTASPANALENAVFSVEGVFADAKNGETAALGSNKALVLRMTDAGQLQYMTTDRSNAWKDITGNAVVIRDSRNTFTLVKEDNEGSALSGAVFTVTPVGGAVFADGTGSEKSIDAQSVTWTGQLVAGSIYRIEETKTPAFYYPASPFEVSVDADGVLSAAPGTTLPLGVGISGRTVTVKDYPTAVSVSKVDSAGTALSGAILRITDVSGTAIVGEWTSSTSPEVITGKLTAGEQYVLEEVTAPSGYEKADPVSFTVENTAGKSEGIMRTDVVMKDQKTPSSPGSGGGGGTPTVVPGKPLTPASPVVPPTPVTPPTPDLPPIPGIPPVNTTNNTTSNTQQYFDVNGNLVPAGFRGDMYDQNGDMVRGKFAGYDKYGKRLPGTGEGSGSTLPLYGGLMAAAAWLFIWTAVRRKKEKK